MARFINSLGYKEITLKSDTEPAIIAFRNRVAENCNAEVTAVKRGHAFKRTGRERSDVVAPVSSDHQVPCGELHTRRTPRILPVVTEGVRNNSAECFVVTAEGVFRAREVRRIEHQDRWDKDAINNVIGVPSRIADGKNGLWTGH